MLLTDESAKKAENMKDIDMLREADAKRMKSKKRGRVSNMGFWTEDLGYTLA